MAMDCTTLLKLSPAHSLHHRDTVDAEQAKPTLMTEVIPEEPDDALDRGFFGLFDEVDSMMGRHRHAGRPTRPLTMDQRKSGSFRSRWEVYVDTCSPVFPDPTVPSCKC